jgi:hypothetical protein
VILRIAAKRAGNRLMYGHFAESTHDDEDYDPAQDVREQDRGAGELDCIGGATMCMLITMLLTEIVAFCLLLTRP